MDTNDLKCYAAYYKDFLIESEANSIYDKIINEYLFNEEFSKSQPNHLKIPELEKVMLMDEDIYEQNELPNEIWGKTAPWFEEIKQLRQRIEDTLQWPFHIGVCIYYPDGNTKMDFHYDPPAFGSTQVIASVSLGAERVFQLKDVETNDIQEELLQHGSLFVMGKGCQEHYVHALAEDVSCSKPRINITFRTKGYNTKTLH